MSSIVEFIKKPNSKGAFNRFFPCGIIHLRKSFLFLLTCFYLFTIFTIKGNTKGGVNMAVVTKSVRIDPDLWHRARVKAMSEKMTLQELITNLLKQYLGEGK